jgi:hypothetical protein
VPEIEWPDRIGELENHADGLSGCKRLTGHEELVLAVASTDDFGYMRLVDNDADSLHLPPGGAGNSVNLQTQPIVTIASLRWELEHGATAHGPGRFLHIRPTLTQKLESDAAREAFNQSFTAHRVAP